MARSKQIKNKLTRPFMKWPGGKKGISEFVLHRLPEKIKTYYEPLVGGGFIFFQLYNLKRFDNAVLSDKNKELINCYKVIQNKVDSLIQELSNGKYIYEKETFLKIREWSISALSDVEQAARLIYLNKTCFNGLYRVNQDGGFNVPFGKYKNPKILDEENLRNINRALQRVAIYDLDFADVCADVQHGDAVYFDPPYIPLSKTSKFTSYTADGFTIDDHIRLQNTFRRIAARGDIRIVLSNSGSKKTMELYKDFDMDFITGNRSIGGPASYRNSVKEVLIYAGPKTYDS